MRTGRTEPWIVTKQRSTVSRGGIRIEYALESSLDPNITTWALEPDIWRQEEVPAAHAEGGPMFVNAPSEAEIYAMDGLELTRLAWQLGLAPRHAVVSCGVGYWVESAKVPWEPHGTLTQADALFRSLRSRRWSTLVDGQDDYGFCQATHLSTLVKVITWWSLAPQRGENIDATEALALTRCAVLAAYKDTILNDYDTAEDGWTSH
jgi:hypothetical protein